MHVVRRGVVLATAMSLGVAAAAHAQGVALQGIVSASGGYSDNIASAPDIPAAGMAGPQSDSFAAISPQLVLSYGGARTVQRFSYVFSANLYTTHSEANTYSHHVDWSGYFEPTARTTLLTGIDVSGGQFNAFQLQKPADQAMLAPLPQGGFGYLAASGSETLTYLPDPRWRYFETLGIAGFGPIASQSAVTSYTFGLTLGAQRSFTFDALSADLRSTYALFGDPPAGGNSLVGSDQILETAAAHWRHDLRFSWSTELWAGASLVFLADDPSRYGYQLSGGASLRYASTEGQAELAYARQAVPNVLVAQAFFVDEVSLRGSLPLGRTNLLASAGLGYQHGSLINLGSGRESNTIDVYLADAQLAWHPQPWPLGLAVRYQRFQQSAEAPPGMMGAAPSLTRNVVLLSVSASWPNGAAPVLPYRSPIRVDRSDEVGLPGAPAQR
jgi:hypothetical protein